MKKYLDLKWICLLLLNVLIITFIFVKQESSSGNQELNSLDKKLTSIQTQLQKPIEKPDLSPITHDLKQLANFIQQLQSKDDHQLGEIFTTEQIAIKKQLDGITDLLRHLDEKKQPIKILPANQLPFKILSIDSIQDVPVASIAYTYKTLALEKGDTLAGWNVVFIDFAKQIIEFENSNKEHVITHLKHLEMGDA
ncbi:hypothetical protein [Legionella septentrionalis]|uniref:Uncharacterized protein n=1 Tax=Legionella septentrionalis TaxID=2498109 RepID=A0A3S0WRC5_9GAMM|nr:hypothetical protein [Legionella septentrionalis]RUQ85143.1 hypothetical protein EKM59_07465 [Legionella septentrionalis]